MKIVIVGTRGIPDFYRGFEKGAQFIALGLAARGHEVTVYCAHNHPHQKPNWQGINLVHIQDPEYKLGSISNFFYDYYCFKDLKHRICDVVIQFGSTCGIWSWMLPKHMILVSNISTILYKNQQHHLLTSKFLELAEKLSVSNSDSIVSDSNLSCAHLRSRYKKRVKFIPSGVETLAVKDQAMQNRHFLKPPDYSLYIGSLDKQNHVEMILDGFVLSANKNRFLVVGDYSTSFGGYLKNKYQYCGQIEFMGSIYDETTLQRLRYFSNICYYGKDEPTYLLIEAMAAGCLLSVYGSKANLEVLGVDAFYFRNSAEIAKQLVSVNNKMADYSIYIENNKKKTAENNNWATVVDQYASHLNYLLSSRKAISSYTNQIKAQIITAK